MSAIQLAQCILLLAGAFALLCLGIVLIKSLSTIEKLNQTLEETNKMINNADNIIDDVNYKLDLINAPIEKLNSVFTGATGRTLYTGARLAGAYRSGKKKSKKQK